MAWGSRCGAATHDQQSLWFLWTRGFLLGGCSSARPRGIMSGPHACDQKRLAASKRLAPHAFRNRGSDVLGKPRQHHHHQEPFLGRMVTLRPEGDETSTIGALFVDCLAGLRGLLAEAVKDKGAASDWLAVASSVWSSLNTRDARNAESTFINCSTLTTPGLPSISATRACPTPSICPRAAWVRPRAFRSARRCSRSWLVRWRG